MRVILSAGKKVYFTLLASSFMFPISAFAQCVDNEDCSALGYKETTNKENCLKCPFGEYWFCPEPEEEKAVLGQCTGYAKNCKIADILYTDGTCSADVVSGKTPIGVVIYISENNCGWAMTATPIATGIQWRTGDEIGFIGVATSQLRQKAIEDFDSCTNTQKIIKQDDASVYPAAWAAVDYVPAGAPETKGKWCLPSSGLLYLLSQDRWSFNIAVSKIGGIQLDNEREGIWSSSRHYNDPSIDMYSVWFLCGDRSGYICYSDPGAVFSGHDGGVHEGIRSVRPVIEF